MLPEKPLSVVSKPDPADVSAPRARRRPLRVLLVYPPIPETFWSMKHALRLVSKKAVIPPLGLLTVAALLPGHWELRLKDLNAENLSDEELLWADYVMLSAMLVQREGAEEAARRCRELGKPLIAGGPMFSSFEEATPLFPHIVRGEAEAVAADLVRDMEHGTLKPRYTAPNRPNLETVPPPRWDLVNFNHYSTMAVQFSRGCPFDCEFCDITAMFGRVPRTKSPKQLVGELEQLRRMGWRGGVFMVDDNFIGNRRRTRELLAEIVRWREENKPKMTFFTEASINLADDAELIELMVRAGFRRVFVGIETPEPESLRECRKVQNQHRDLGAAVRTLQRSGLEVMAGFIIGFDNDPPDIFKRQFEFIQRNGIATAMVGLLTALPQTRLYKRLVEEGRLLAQSTGNNTQAILNFVPKLDADFLIQGYRNLMRRLYEPATYYQRLRVFLKDYRDRGPGAGLTWADLKAFFKSLWILGAFYRGRRQFWRFFLHSAFKHPREFSQAMQLAIVGYHFRRVAETL
ncbi:MAG: DUF4070 domain-containing protein [Verrucomicrobia bacterium]|nr:DUF4070 domain-containing protein [Verrucomicrobiota bacterium]